LTTHGSPINDAWYYHVSWPCRRRGNNDIRCLNSTIEKHFGIPATTRNWNTITAISDILEMQE